MVQTNKRKQTMKTKLSVTGETLPCEIYVDGYMWQALTSLNKYVEHDWDAVGIITGEEGAGKSTVSRQWALLLDKNFSNKNIVFNAEQFEQAISILPPKSVIVWDEADDTGASWASEMMIMLKKTFKRIRKMNYVIFLVTPTFHDMNKYFAIHRSRFLVDVYADGFKRGYFKLFKKDTKRRLYIKGKKEMDMQCVKPDFRGRFTGDPKGMPIDMEAYEKKKDEATFAVLNKMDKSKKDIRVDICYNMVDYFNEKMIPYNQTILANLLSVDQGTVSKYLSNRGDVQ